MSETTKTHYEIQARHTFQHDGRDIVEWWTYGTCPTREAADIVVEKVRKEFEAMRVVEVVVNETREIVG